MNLVNYCRNLTTALFLVVFISGCGEEGGRSSRIGEAPEDLSIGRMRVSIWPEYDDRSVLAIYDGRFDDAASFPLKTSFLIPKGAVISDACSLSFEGQHFCQLYKTIDRGTYDEVRLLLPYPNFYLSFHTPEFDPEVERREFDYRVKANHPIRTMEVDIQQPLRATEFNITPAKSVVVSRGEDNSSMIKGFKHYSYSLEDISGGQETVFKINYLKSDPNPSVDIKYATMDGPRVWGSPYETQKSAKTFVYLLFGSSVFGVLVVIAVFILLKRRKRRGEMA